MKKVVCGECGAEEGHIHNDWCDIETCFFCGQQFMHCDCENKFAYRLPFIHYPNRCSRCGEENPEMFMVKDKEWNENIDPWHRSDIICRPCYNFIKKAVKEARNP